MAKVVLRRSETTAGILPEVCMICGAPATRHVNRTFWWAPDWLSILAVLVCLAGGWLAIVIVVLYFALSKRMPVDVPTCDRHSRYWLRRQLFMYVPLGVFFAVSAAVFGYLLGQPGDVNLEYSLGLCYGGTALFVVWLVVAAVRQQSMIRAKEITDGSITLIKVHDRFVAALQELRDRDDLEDEDLELRPRRPPPLEVRDPRDAFRAEREPGEL
jgi:hypothetical protein